MPGAESAFRSGGKSGVIARPRCGVGCRWFWRVGFTCHESAFIKDMRSAIWGAPGFPVAERKDATPV